MIKFHPNDQMLASFSAGELPLSLSIAISAHIEMCSKCAQQAAKVEESLSQDTWQASDIEYADFGDMLQGIMSDELVIQKKSPKQVKATANVAGKQYILPTAFRKFSDLKWSGFGVVSRARIINNEGNVRASLLHIDKGGRIPEHQHKGYELTLLLDGSFSDESGEYHKGDFILLTGDEKHSPYTKDGCLCYAVQDAPLHFVSGVSKILNPLGNLIY